MHELAGRAADFIETALVEGRTGMLRVWRFEDAPAALRELSEHGGDEDWLLLLPPDFAMDYIRWAQSGTPFGSYAVSEHRLPNGWEVRIGAHS